MNGYRVLPFAAAFLLVALVGCVQRGPEIDLQAVSSVTLDSLTEMDIAVPGNGTGTDVTASPDGSASGEDTVELLRGFSDVLERNYNAQEPPLFESAVSVVPQEDASFVAVADTNGNGEPDENEPALWMVEIDGENERVVVTDGQGAVDQAGFSGTSLLAGYFLARMLTRQRAAGVDTRALANKRPVTARQAARARAGSGSFARGK